MKGVVLCGGQSTRMGADKGLLKLGNITWAELAASKLSSLQIPVSLSVHKEQAAVYSKIFSPGQLIIDNEALSIKGPLLGVLSAHQNFPDEDLFILACDMIEMSGSVLQDLVNNYQQVPFEAFVYTTSERIQSLCGIYSSMGLKKIHHLLQHSKLKKFSMLSVLELLNANYISVPEPLLHCFTNYNSQEELTSNHF
jgi:molybdopterin-guanine dinucleotide biosynthesis protein A